MEQRIKTGDIVQHFKRELVAREPGNESAYLYEVISIDGIDTVTDSRVVVYRALYGPRTIFVRPYEDFMSEVDHIKYPNIHQKYRFEPV